MQEAKLIQKMKNSDISELVEYLEQELELEPERAKEIVESAITSYVKHTERYPYPRITQALISGWSLEEDALERIKELLYKISKLKNDLIKNNNSKGDKEMDTQQEESKILPEKYPELLPHTADDFVSFLVGFAQLLEKCPSLKGRKTLSSGKVKYKITDNETVWINSPKKVIKLYIKQNFSTPSFDFSRQKGHIPREIFLPDEKDRWDLWLQETGTQLGLEKEQSPNSDELPSPKDIPSSTESIEDYRGDLKELGFSDKDIGRLTMKEAERIVEESIQKEGHYITEGLLKAKKKRITTDQLTRVKGEKIGATGRMGQFTLPHYELTYDDKKYVLRPPPSQGNTQKQVIEWVNRSGIEQMIESGMQIEEIPSKETEVYEEPMPENLRMRRYLDPTSDEWEYDLLGKKEGQKSWSILLERQEEEYFKQILESQEIDFDSLLLTSYEWDNDSEKFKKVEPNKEESEKEPYEMTREEARSHWEEIIFLPPEERPGGQHAPFVVFGQPSEEIGAKAWEWFCQEVEEGEDIHQIDKHHYASILTALSENKSVPKEVLADYPGLKIDTSEEGKVLSDSSEKELPKELQSLSKYLKKWGKWNDQDKWTVEAKGLEEARRLEAEIEKLDKYEAEKNFIEEDFYSVYFFHVSKLEKEEETDTWKYGECPVPQDPKSFLDVDPDDLPKCLWSVRLWLKGIDEDYQEEKEKFLGDAKGNLTYAVEWAEDKVKAEWKWVQVDIFRRKNFNTPEKVFQILKELYDTEKQNLVKGYGMPSSTGHFANAVALAQHEARVDLVSDLHWIEHGLKHFLEKHS